MLICGQIHKQVDSSLSTELTMCFNLMFIMMMSLEGSATVFRALVTFSCKALRFIFQNILHVLVCKSTGSKVCNCFMRGLSSNSALTAVYLLLLHDFLFSLFSFLFEYIITGCPQSYIPSTLNIDLILWHTQLIVCATV